MARKSVKQFSVNVVNNTVVVEIHTENKKPYRYQIFPDDVHGDVQGIAAHLQAGLAEAQRTFQKIEVSEFFERRYVTIVTPIKRVENRYTADKL
ncbi:hypothetical protein [Marinobacterium weihaiense]|uniref:KTSC domain-containing protein n=1 Tax=Marinobacterium weihaiense TaxID=2851016 RepID=A0ABS6MF33_9GAMM|nr:hypothetical protein [Marinobacterium weihaiense]MBV0934929.1 hypothetical protein [Marinobacterium weihaiense]